MTKIPIAQPFHEILLHEGIENVKVLGLCNQLVTTRIGNLINDIYSLRSCKYNVLFSIAEHSSASHDSKSITLETVINSESAFSRSSSLDGNLNSFIAMHLDSKAEGVRHWRMPNGAITNSNAVMAPLTLEERRNKRDLEQTVKQASASSCCVWSGNIVTEEDKRIVYLLQIAEKMVSVNPAISQHYMYANIIGSRLESKRKLFAKSGRLVFSFG